MVEFPLKVKRRDGAGGVVEILSDTADDAKSVATQLRAVSRAATDVWIEDVNGQPVDESAL